MVRSKDAADATLERGTESPRRGRAAAVALGSPKASPKRSVKKTASKGRPAAKHPNYLEMVGSAIVALKERKGSSRTAILKYISGHYEVGGNQNRVRSHVRMALQKGTKMGKFVPMKGSFKLAGATTKAVGRKKGKAVKKSRAKKIAIRAAGDDSTGKKPRTKKAAVKSSKRLKLRMKAAGSSSARKRKAKASKSKKVGA